MTLKSLLDDIYGFRVSGPFYDPKEQPGLILVSPAWRDKIRELFPELPKNTSAFGVPLVCRSYMVGFMILSRKNEIMLHQINDPTPKPEGDE